MRTGSGEYLCWAAGQIGKQATSEVTARGGDKAEESKVRLRVERDQGKGSMSPE